MAQVQHSQLRVSIPAFHIGQWQARVRQTQRWQTLQRRTFSVEEQ
jgi:hypothetical protein